MMTKDELIESAKKIDPPELAIAESFGAKREMLVSRVIDSLCQRKDIDRLVGQDNITMMKDNVSNMSRFMESMFNQYAPEAYVETILWVFRAYRSHGFQLAFWSAHLNAWIETIRSEQTDENLNQLIPFYEWIQIHIPQFTALTDESVSDAKSE